MLVLLSSSKTCASGGNGAPVAATSLGTVSRRIWDTATSVASTGSDAEASALFDATGTTLDRARDLHLDLAGAPTMRAGERYTGQQWLQRRATEPPVRAGRGDRAVVVIVSGLFGFITEDTPIPAYRIAVGARLPDATSVARLWHGQCVDALAPLVEQHGGPIIDLLPGESRQAVDHDGLLAAGVEVLTVAFTRSDGRAAPSVRAKQARGALARHLARGRALQSFTSSPDVSWKVRVRGSLATVAARSGC